ncbi:MAG TPA: homoserine kinase [Novosphingobium sp.]|nr:homoserine kinase [Novosphingobium sp.]
MAVYTHLDDSAFAALIAAYDVGAPLMHKGIAEGVSNTNFIVETTGGPAGGPRFILTIYEARTEVADLPFFLGLLDHLAARGCPVPRTIHDRQGALSHAVAGADGGQKPAALIEFLPGVSLSRPTPAQARAVGQALARVHLAAADFPMARANGMGLATWRDLLDGCGAAGLAAIDPALGDLVACELPALAAHWPDHLPTGIIHADLFPDNVLMLGEDVTGLIDFYFACTDTLAYDVAVTHAAWCFSADGRQFDAGISAALLAGYEAVRPLSAEERAALPLLARGAAMRFLATRAYDWLHTPADALVTRKDPMAFARRLEFYADPAHAGLFAA